MGPLRRSVGANLNTKKYLCPDLVPDPIELMNLRRQLFMRLRRKFSPRKADVYYCPNKEAAMGIIVVSLTCTAYLWATLIAL